MEQFPKFSFALKKIYLSDILAGITIGIVAIPQAMAFSLLAGLPPIYGLYGTFIPLLIYALLGTSAFLSVGPVSVISIFVFMSLQDVASPFSSEYINLVMVLGIMVGGLQILFGGLRLGKFIAYLPKSVVSGFVQAAALVIIISQLPQGFGFVLEKQDGLLADLMLIIQHLPKYHGITFLLFLSSLILLFGGVLFYPNFPTSIVLLLFSGVIAFAFNLEEQQVALIGEIPNGLPSFILPQFYQEQWQIFPSAFGIAFIASVGSFVMAKSLEKEQHSPWQPDRDMLALGVSKVVGSFFGGLLSAGSFNRSILSYKVGTKSQFSSIVASLVILFTMLFLTQVIYYLPQSVIAAIIVYSAYFLFDFKGIKNMILHDKPNAVILLLTMTATLSLGFVEGIFVGVFLAVLGRQLKWIN